MNLATNKIAKTVGAPHTATVRSVAIHPDGDVFASVADDGSLKLWQYPTGALMRTLQLGPPRGQIYQVEFSPDGRFLCTANGNGTIYVLDATAAVENSVSARAESPAGS